MDGDLDDSLHTSNNNMDSSSQMGSSSRRRSMDESSNHNNSNSIGTVASSCKKIEANTTVTTGFRDKIVTASPSGKALIVK